MDETSGTFQREYFWKNIPKQIVQGYFYTNGKRTLRKIARFEKVGLDPSGEPIKQGKRSIQNLEKRLFTLYNEVEAKLLASTAPKKHKSTERISTLSKKWFKLANVDSATVRKFYEPTIEKYIRFVSDSSVDIIDQDCIDTFRTRLKENGLTAPTVNIHLKTLRTFLNWAHKRDYIEKVPDFEMVKGIQKLPHIYSDDELRQLFVRISELKNDKNSRRARCYTLQQRFLFTAIGTGFRRSEALYLTWDQINFDECFITVRSNEYFKIKEGEDKVRPILPFAAEYLQKELERTPEEKWLLDDGKGDPFYLDPVASLKLLIDTNMH